MNTAILPQLPQAAFTPVGAEVYRGLTSQPKTLSPWLFYDREGSELFERITELDEYYLTRTERAIFAEYADDILAAASAGIEAPPLRMFELGAGAATKTGLLLAAAVRRQGSVEYHAIDVSETALAAAQRNLEQAVPGVRVYTGQADYTEDLSGLGPSGAPRLVLYIGSSIGNFDAPAALELLRSLRQRLGPGDRLLLGMDMVKDLPTLLAAYDDAKRVTAAFNRNVLLRINRELGANFHPQCFRHKVRWNGELSRIEMHMESLIRQTVAIPELQIDVSFRRGETVHTENSYKYTPERIAQMLARSGFRLAHRWTDPQKWFSVVLAEVRVVCRTVTPIPGSGSRTAWCPRSAPGRWRRARAS